MRAVPQNRGELSRPEQAVIDIQSELNRIVEITVANSGLRPSASYFHSGSDCNQTALVLQAIQDTNADLSVHLGVYVSSTRSPRRRSSSVVPQNPRTTR